MSGRRRGRPRKNEHAHMGELLWLERLLEQETAALRQQGHRSPSKALIRAAILLGISERSAWRLLAEMERENERFTAQVASFAALWRKTYGSRSEKNDGTDLLAAKSCSATE